jgi:hypothetical protein
MRQGNELWDKARAAFAAHQLRGIDHTPQLALNRIAAKCLGISFDETSCAIREELLALDDLNTLEVFHDKDVPSQDHEPIVVLSFCGKRYVIDGNKRVNAWRKTGKPQTRRAIIIEPTDALADAAEGKVVAKSRPEKKSPPSAPPAARCILPMEKFKT